MIRRVEYRRRGAIAVLIAFLLVPILAITAIAIDGGTLLDQRRRVQSAADTAALAAAFDLYKNFSSGQGLDPSGTARTAARSSAYSNGYTNDTTNSVVTV